MTHQCEVKELRAQPSLAIPTRTPVQELPCAVGASLGAIAQYLAELGEPPAGPPFVTYYNNDMQDLDIEIGFPVARELPGRGDIQASESVGGKAATCLYTGPYSDMEAAYNVLLAWMEEQGYEATGVAHEVYLSDPDEVPPEELLTEIVFPLK